MANRPHLYLSVSRFFLSYGIFVFLAVLCVFFQIMSGREMYPDGGLAGWWSAGKFLGIKNLSNILRQTSITTILGVGMTLVIISGGIDLSVGSVLALAGVLSAAVMMTGFPPPFPYPAQTPDTTAWPLILAIPAAVLTAGVVGAVCGMHNAIPIVKLRVPPFIATLAMFSIARGFAYIYVAGGEVTHLPDEFTDAVAQGPLMIIAALLAVVFGHVLLTQTRFGRAVYAIGGNEQAARLSGISIGGTKFWVYTICGLLAGLAGLLLTGRTQAGDPQSGMGYELNAIAAVVLGGTSLMGGVGTVLGTLLGAIVMGCLQNGLELMGVQWFVQMLVKGYVILLAVVLDQAKKRR